MTAFVTAVLGAGMQGCAAGFELARSFPEATVLFFDASVDTARSAAARVNALVGRNAALGRGLYVEEDGDGLKRALDGCRAVFSALPYFLNVAAAEAAVHVGAHFCDLGGNTGVVRRELALAERAAARGVCVVPDCGLAPGLANQTAARLIASMDAPETVKIRCGGIPVNPRPPMNYRLVFSATGLVNEYLGVSECVRNGRVTTVPTLTEDEMLDLPEPFGRMEASVTSGGTSLAPERFAGRVRDYDYKTVRWPGHFAQVRLLRDLGLLDDTPRTVGRLSIAPRAVTEALLRERLAFPDDRDAVVLLVTCEGRENGEPVVRRAWLHDEGDSATGFTAMERTTAFPAVQVLVDAIEGRIPPGAWTPEAVAVSPEYFAALASRGVRISFS
jgi:lysine 6-dehydrogenase